MKPFRCLAMSLLSCLCVHAQDLRQTDPAKAACGAPDDQFKTEWVKPASTTPQPGKALVYFIQTGATVAVPCVGRCGPVTKLGMDGAWLGAVEGSSFLMASVTPGAHHLCSNWQSHIKKLSDLVALHGFNAETGRSYYFGIDVTDGGREGSYNLSIGLLDEDEGRMLVSAYPYSQSTKK